MSAQVKAQTAFNPASVAADPRTATCAPADEDWSARNQRLLGDQLERLERLLRAHRTSHAARAAAESSDDVETISARSADDQAAELPAALALVCERFGLTSFERDLLVLCAGVELRTSFAQACAGDGMGHCAPTFGLALAVLPDAYWAALSPSAPLRRFQLLTVGVGETLTNSPLRIDERVLHALVGVDLLDEPLTALISFPGAPASLPESQQQLASEVAAALRSSPSAPLIRLVGPDATARREIANLAAARVGLRLGILQASSLPTNASDATALARLWTREALLGTRALLLDMDDSDVPDLRRRSELLLSQLYVPVMQSSRERPRDPGRVCLTVNVERPTVMEQRARWATALVRAGNEDEERIGVQGSEEAKRPELSGPASGPGSLTQFVHELTAHFDLSAAAIDQICAAVAVAGASPSESALRGAVWSACRQQNRLSLDELAQRIDVRASWDALVLPDVQTATLRQLVAQVRQRGRVYDDWGFGARETRGLGINALFFGPSGTGKTLAAEVLAYELRLDLYRIDLSQMVSKYIGETEKNLRRVFDAAEQSGAVLVFDEADALFGKRSEVKDSHDRYANIEVGYLLQRMESYRGLAILTTNLKSSIDAAFVRRLRFMVPFVYPGFAERVRLWRGAFPASTPTQGLDCERLAKLNVAGGHIRNIALSAAFLAADAGEPVRMNHLLRAAQLEAAKLERPLSASEVGDWESGGRAGR